VYKRQEIFRQDKEYKSRPEGFKANFESRFEGFKEQAERVSTL